MAASKMADGISHMSAMAKSKMQAELVAKVKLRHINSEKSNDVPESDVTDAAALQTALAGAASALGTGTCRARCPDRAPARTITVCADPGAAARMA